MTRKAHGWITNIMRDTDTKEPHVLIHLCFNYKLDNLKTDDCVCLVPPELLTWVEKVRHVFKECSSGEHGHNLHPDYGLFLKRLNEIWPEDKSND